MTAPTRRAALTALAGVPALAIPAGAIAAAPDADAQLFALQAEIEAADAREKAALDAHTVVEDAYHAVRPPKPVPPAAPETVLTAAEQELFERIRQSINKRPPDPFEVALEAWNRESERLEIECGLPDAEDSVKAAQEAVDAICQRVAAIRATRWPGSSSRRNTRSRTTTANRTRRS